MCSLCSSLGSEQWAEAHVKSTIAGKARHEPGSRLADAQWAGRVAMPLVVLCGRSRPLASPRAGRGQAAPHGCRKPATDVAAQAVAIGGGRRPHLLGRQTPAQHGPSTIRYRSCGRLCVRTTLSVSRAASLGKRRTQRTPPPKYATSCVVPIRPPCASDLSPSSPSASGCSCPRHPRCPKREW